MSLIIVSLISTGMFMVFGLLAGIYLEVKNEKKEQSHKIGVKAVIDENAKPFEIEAFFLELEKDEDRELVEKVFSIKEKVDQLTYKKESWNVEDKHNFDVLVNKRFYGLILNYFHFSKDEKVNKRCVLLKSLDLIFHQLENFQHKEMATFELEFEKQVRLINKKR